MPFLTIFQTLGENRYWAKAHRSYSHHMVRTRYLANFLQRKVRPHLNTGHINMSRI